MQNRREKRVIFFFTSRRRHTIYWRDWSSDVCSSDRGHGASPLTEAFLNLPDRPDHQLNTAEGLRKRHMEQKDSSAKLCRSEERRGGKECRSRWSPYH